MQDYRYFGMQIQSCGHHFLLLQCIHPQASPECLVARHRIAERRRNSHEDQTCLAALFRLWFVAYVESARPPCTPSLDQAKLCTYNSSTTRDLQVEDKRVFS
jgi:hypothetical protein